MVCGPGFSFGCGRLGNAREMKHTLGRRAVAFMPELGDCGRQEWISIGFLLAMSSLGVCTLRCAESRYCTSLIMANTEGVGNVDEMEKSRGRVEWWWNERVCLKERNALLSGL